MDDKTKQDFIILFNQGFEEVVLPQIEDLGKRVDKLEIGLSKMRNELYEMKGELSEVQDGLNKVNQRLGKVENILEEVVIKQEAVARLLPDHERRIKRLENRSSN